MPRSLGPTTMTIASQRFSSRTIFITLAYSQGSGIWLVVDNWQMAKKQIPSDQGLAAIEAGNLPTATRYLLQEIEKRYPGGTVELRVPPYGAIQCIAGMDHRRGTPPNVVELEPQLFVELCLGKSHWQESAQPGKSVSGAMAQQVASIFPLSL
ncbi:MAG: hypothetical protein RLZ65_895 [Actinomycetota bacterium]